ncbi:MAG: hypothetical protein HY274_01475 [Gammaproteobacteria bacterium]|nr:hypothetical protein [Gammaproteobacteria bacterium]
MSVDTTTHRSGFDRRFSTGVAIAAALIVFMGFARSYYLKGVFGTPSLPGLVHLHGIVMTLWFALFVAQVRLIAAHRTDLHRRVGVVGALLAVLVLVVGVTTAIVAAKRGFTPGPPPLVFLSIPLGDMLVFAVLVSLGLLFRRRRDIHRRLMLLSSVGILAAAIARIPFGFIETGGPLVFFGLTDLCVLACVVFDTVKNHRLHPAFGWGILFIVASQPLRLMLTSTAVWMQFAVWLTT